MQRNSTELSGEAHSPLPPPTCCPIVELRQYTLHPGMRDTLVDLFEREFVESQEALGIRVIGQFRDLDDPERFVWLRGFRDMQTRAEALKAFYGGSIWKSHREAANATMIDSDNVLLLRPVTPESGFALEDKHRLPMGANEPSMALIVATLYYFDEPVTSNFLDFFAQELKPCLASNGAAILACFTTEDSANTFPALPVREGENVFVWFAKFHDPSAYEDHEAAIAQSGAWRNCISKLMDQVKRPFEILKLSPTARSMLDG